MTVPQAMTVDSLPGPYGAEPDAAPARSAAPAAIAAPIITATPPKPSSTPTALAGVIRSSRVNRWATITPQIGVVALRIEARPLAIWVWLQANSEKGMALLSKASTIIAPSANRAA